MKYFFDTEFLEGTQKERFPISLFRKNTPNTIDLISIGVVSDDGREYYAISKDFNLKEAWNRFQLKKLNGINPSFNFFGFFDGFYGYEEEYWIRENVLKPIFDDMLYSINPAKHDTKDMSIKKFTYENFKFLLNKYGKTNKQIAKEIKDFCLDNVRVYKSTCGKYIGGIDPWKGEPEFYAYYADYDWVVFCWLFGKMIDLPDGFPMYCIDLKQILEEKANSMTTMEITDAVYGKGEMNHNVYSTWDSGVLTCSKSKLLMDAKNYSTLSLKQTNNHNALADAKWNHELYKFIKSI